MKSYKIVSTMGGSKTCLFCRDNAVLTLWIFILLSLTAGSRPWPSTGAISDKQVDHSFDLYVAILWQISQKPP